MKDQPQRPAPIEPLEEARDYRPSIMFEAVTIALVLIGSAIGGIAGWLELLAKVQP